MYCHGRRKIYTDVSQIDSSNVLSVLADTYPTHLINRTEIQYLYDYYKGKTPILSKTKEIRPEINNKINVNRANEIVNFKLGYTFGEPVHYVHRGEKKDDNLSELNTLMELENKHLKDKELAEWLFICGTSYRMVLPGNPISIYTLDPRSTYVIYKNDYTQKPLASVTYVKKVDGSLAFTIYTDAECYQIGTNGDVEKESILIKSVEPIYIGNPIIEYPANNSRLGSFEIVLPLLDAINDVESNRLDNIVQTVNSFLAIMGGRIDEEGVKSLEKLKMLCLPEGVDAKYLTAPMQQSDLQVISNSLYQSVLTIVGMPNRNSEGAGGDNGVAVQLRNGWSSAEAQAKSITTMFVASEMEFLKLVTKICDILGRFKLSVENIAVKIPRHNAENMMTKAQTLQILLACGIDPESAVAYVDMFSDPTDVYERSSFEATGNSQPILDN